MADDSIYGKLTEHPEFPITDENHFTVSIRRHPYEEPVFDPRFSLRPMTGCARCGFPQFETDWPYQERGRLHPVHRV
jgi:hypothetical protein